MERGKFRILALTELVLLSGETHPHVGFYRRWLVERTWLLERNTTKPFLDNNFLLGAPSGYFPLRRDEGTHPFRREWPRAPCLREVGSLRRRAAACLGNTGLGVQERSVVPGSTRPTCLLTACVQESRSSSKSMPQAGKLLTDAHL